MAGTNLQTGTANDFCRFCGGQTCGSSKLDGMEADFARPAQRGCKIGGSRGEVSQRVELNGDLLGFHDRLISSIW
jgi:hypothetical protein